MVTRKLARISTVFVSQGISHTGHHFWDEFLAQVAGSHIHQHIARGAEKVNKHT